jgi:hypothetical protein
MPLTKLQFRPGINRETTSYSNEGGWFDCDKVRFRFGYPEKIGGWVKKSGLQYQGTARALHPFVALDGTPYIGVGTHLKYYIEEGGGFNDITPIRSTTSAGDVTFSATDGSTEITVSDTAHGAVVNDFVTFSGAVTLGGDITADILNDEYQITEIVDDNSYKIESSVAANSSDTGNGGSSVVGEYQINVGLDTSVGGSGWGAGLWSRSTWGSSSPLTVVTDVLRIWSHDNFGEDLIINVRDGGIYYWDKSTSSSPISRAVELKDVTGNDDTTTPTIAKKILVSDNDRHTIAFGCDPFNDIGTQDPLLIRFSDQENPLEWLATPDNTAGDLRIGSGSQIVTALETRQQILVWTDVSLHSMQYLGAPFTFGIDQITSNTSIMGPLSAIAVDDFVFWMGSSDFYQYNGQVTELPCSVRSFVFDDFNFSQKEKVTASLNNAFNEVWWFYPSAESSEVDRYVVYNYQQQSWFYGSLSRTAWIDRGVSDFPIAASDGYLYFHEAGSNDGSTVPVSPINAYIESSQIDIEDGDSFSFISRMIPDLTFAGSNSESPSATLTVKTRNFPGGNYLQENDSSVTKTATTPVEQFTNQVHLRLRGRSFAFRIESDAIDTEWRLGTPRVDIRPDGRR